MTQKADDAALDPRQTSPELHLTAVRPPETDHLHPQLELPRDRNQAILEATKLVGSLLKKNGHAFALAGSVAVYAHGGTQNLQHDADFCIRPEDAERVAATLRDAGLVVITPPEDWLLKAKCLGQDIDLIYELAHEAVNSQMLDRAETLSVDSVHMPVLTATDLMRSLIAAFSEHHCDFGAVLPIARALREKVDWEQVRTVFGNAPMPDAFLYLLERLEVIAPLRQPLKEPLKEPLTERRKERP
ncbi:hypothetical protein ACFV6E_01615 [Streptomyces sp. NPDC059785]|uniref:hypothetical protein n=1 Tax=unclassified Streptomyces TaxID=2593676 RepID=UPI003658C46D